MRKITLKRSLLALSISGALLSMLAADMNYAYAASADESLGLANMSRRNTQRIAVQQAIIALASEGSDIDGDGYIEAPPMLTSTSAPAGGGIIPLSSAAPKTDSYGSSLGYCSFDVGSTNVSTGRLTGPASGYGHPVLTVLSAGNDNIFQSSCANIATGVGVEGDDYGITYNSTQIQMGNSGTLYYGDPVADPAALTALGTSMPDGHVRFVKSAGTFYRYNSVSGLWNAVGAAALSLNRLTAADGANNISNQDFDQTWKWKLTSEKSAFSILESAASTGGTADQKLVNIGTLAGSTAVPLAVASGGVEVFRISPTSPQILAANGTATAPTYSFKGSPNSGLYLPSVGQIAISEGGSKVLGINQTNKNITIGASAYPGTTYTDVIAIGSSAGYRLIGSRSIAIGNGAVSGSGGSGGDDNVHIGQGSGRYSKAKGTIAIGTAATSNVQGDYNVAVGMDTLGFWSAKAAFKNTALGYQAMGSNGDASYNVAVGAESLTTVNGDYNVGVGYLTLRSLAGITGARNVGIGYNSGRYNISGGDSVFIGANSQLENTAAMSASGFITLVGANSLAAGLAAANQNAYMTAIGAGSIVASVNTVVLGRPTDVTVIGASTNNLSGNSLQVTGGIQAVTGNIVNNSGQFIGAPGSMVAPTYSFAGNVGTGLYSPALNQIALSSAGKRNMLLHGALISIGEGSAASDNGASYNIGIGNNALANSIGSDNIAIGRNAFKTNYAGDRVVAIGSNALSGTNEVSDTVAIGANALFQTVDALNTIAIGSSTGGNTNVTDRDIIIGHSAASGATMLARNTIIGAYSLPKGGTFEENVALGALSLRHLEGGVGNTGIGTYALADFKSGNFNTSLGFRTDVATATGQFTGSYNTLIGAESKLGALGWSANMDTGHHVTLLGAEASATLPTNAVIGAYMTAVGAGARVSSIDTIVLGRATDKTVIGASASNGSAALLQLNGASQHIGIPTTSAPVGSAGMMYYDSTLNRLQFHDGTMYRDMTHGGKVPLSNIIPATQLNTIDNSNYAQTWNWQLTGDDTAFDIGETAASTGGTGTQRLMKIGTKLGSTAIPLSVYSQGVEALRVNNENPQVQVDSGTSTRPGLAFIGHTQTGFWAGLASISLNVEDESNGAPTRGMYIHSTKAMVALGPYSLASQDLAVYSGSVAIGSDSLWSNVNGYNNTGVGTSSLVSNTSGWDNTAVGADAMYGNKTGTENTAIGYFALGNLVGGSRNVAIGRGADVDSTPAMENSSYITLLGAGSWAQGLPAAADAYMTAVGAGAIVSTANTVVLGRSSDTTVIGATGTSGSVAKLQVKGAIQQIGLAAAPSGAAGMTYFNSVSKQLQYHNGTGWKNLSDPNISQISAAIASNTIANAAHAQNWNWTLTGNTTAFSIGETAASTGGTTNQRLMTVATKAGSTAIPFSVYTRGVEAMRVDSVAAQLQVNAGSTTTPGLAFIGHKNTGLYSENNILAMDVEYLGGSPTKYRAFYLNTDTSEVGIGMDALSNVSKVYAGATWSTAIGAFSLRNNTSGSHNSAVGYVSLIANTTGYNNSAMGAYALESNTTGSENAAVGNGAGMSNTTGSFNTAMGVWSLEGSDTGSYNTGLGHGTHFDTAFVGMQDSSYITLIGAGASATGLNAPADAYMTAIGAGSTVGSINTVVLGRPIDNVVVGQSVSGPQQFFVNGTAGGTSAYAVSSDIRFKRDILELRSAMDTLRKLQGVSYEFNHAAFPNRKFESGRQLGFIAQQIEPFVPQIVRTDASGYKSVQYSQLVPMIVEGLKEHDSVLKHFSKTNDVTLTVDIATIEGNEAHFKRIESEEIKVKNLEAYNAKIAKLQAEEIEAKKIDSKFIRSDVVKTGETESYIGAGAFQPMFTPNANTQYIVNATSDDGSVAFASVSVMAGRIVITAMTAKGIDIIAVGDQVGFAAANKFVKATWIRMS